MTRSTEQGCGVQATRRMRAEGKASTSDPINSAEMRRMIERALAPGGPLRRLGPELEQRYQAASWRGRNRGIQSWLLVVAVINFMCIGLDVVVMPAFIMHAIVARGLVLTGIYLGAAWVLRRRRPLWVQSMAVCVPAMALVVVAGYLGHLAGGVHAERYYTGAMFASFAAVVVTNIPVRHAVLQVVASLTVFEVMLLGQPGRSVAENFTYYIELIAYYPMCVLVALDVRRWMERMHRRNFLLAERDEMRVMDLAVANKRLLKLSNTDALTGVSNRRFFDAALSLAWQKADAAGDWLGVMMVDVDHFKSLNDAAGHAEGDRCLQAIATAVQQHVREGDDLVARYGGEEFVAILPAAGREVALVAAERVRRAVKDLRIPHPGRPRQFVTVSVGVACARPTLTSQSPEMLLRTADAALYMAKASGRDHVCYAAGEDQPAPSLIPDQQIPDQDPEGATMTARALHG